MDSLQTYIPRKCHGKCSSSFSKDESVSFWSSNVWVATSLSSFSLIAYNLWRWRVWRCGQRNDRYFICKLKRFALTIFFFFFYSYKSGLYFLLEKKKISREKGECLRLVTTNMWLSFQSMCFSWVLQEEIRRWREMDKKIYIMTPFTLLEPPPQTCSSGQPPSHSWSPSVQHTVQHVSWGLAGWDHVSIGCLF